MLKTLGLSRIFAGTLIVLTTLLLASCAVNHTSTKTVYKADESFEPLSSVLVIGIGKNRDNVKSFETMMVEKLESNGINAVSAHRKLAKDLSIDRASATQLMRDYQSQGAIVVRVLDAKINRSEKERRKELVAEASRLDSFWNVFAIDVTEEDVILDPSDEISTAFLISTEVYSAANGNKLSILETEVSGIEDARSKMLSAISHSIDALKSEKVLE
ncbi:hypothetical protein PN836_007920 [Ningiella sp. W23]|uniref:hypothetical protein n=1 Tax=Ningiella sp. W23 TaxID=3023715 RepID=UPI003758037F